MAKRAKTFAEKALGKKLDSPACPECGQVYEVVLVVNSEKREENGEWKFARSRVKVCKCNEKEVYA